jgi:hypothetical protein
MFNIAVKSETVGAWRYWLSIEEDLSRTNIRKKSNTLLVYTISHSIVQPIRWVFEDFVVGSPCHLLAVNQEIV